MVKRALAVTLVFCTLLLCACQTQSLLSPDIEDETVVRGRFEYTRLDDLKDRDYEGRAFRIAVYDPQSVFPENSESTLSRALTERNARVEEKFRIRLENAGIPQETFFLELQAAYEAGEDVCDIVVAPASMASLFIASDMLLNVYSLPNTDYSKSYYDQNAMRAASLGAMTYEVAGDFVYSPGSYWCVCYNQTLMNWFGFTDFITLARNGQWDWNLFNRYINWFYRDQNGDRVMTDVDLFGLTSSANDETIAKMMWASSGIPFFENDAPGGISMNYDTERTREMIAAINTALNSPGRYSGGGKSPLQLFLDGQSLFYLCPASEVGYFQLRGMSVGLIPLPKQDETQEHFCSYVDPSAPVVYVLNSCADTEFVGTVLQGLFAASENLIYDATMNVYTAYHLTGNAAVNFFDDMIRHGYRDPAFTLGDAIPEVGSASFDVIRQVLFFGGDFASLYRNQQIAFNETYAIREIHTRS